VSSYAQKQQAKKNTKVDAIFLDFQFYELAPTFFKKLVPQRMICGSKYYIFQTILRIYRLANELNKRSMVS
jgi:hypothetical protein